MSDAPVLVITGASSGIGAATARAARDAGYELVLAGRDQGRLGAVADATDGLAVVTDVSRWEDNEALVAAALERFGRIDAVFANAGFMVQRAELSEHPQRWLNERPEDWQDMINTNVLGAAFTARAALPALLDSKGHLVLTSSSVGRVVIPGSMYSASKFAVTAMGEALRQDLSGTDVRVTLIEPGVVDTAFFPGTLDLPQLQAEDIARGVLYALSQPPHVDINEILIRPTGQTL